MNEPIEPVMVRRLKMSRPGASADDLCITLGRPQQGPDGVWGCEGSIQGARLNETFEAHGDNEGVVLAVQDALRAFVEARVAEGVLFYFARPEDVPPSEVWHWIFRGRPAFPQPEAFIRRTYRLRNREGVQADLLVEISRPTPSGWGVDMDIRLASPFFSTTLWVDGVDDFEALAEAQIRLPLYLKARLGGEFEVFRQEPGDTDLDRFWDAA